VLIIPCAWGFELTGYNHHHHQLHASHQVFSGAVAGVEVEDLCKGSFSHAHPLLCFIVLLYFIFTCIVLYQKHKKLVYFIVAFIYLLLVHHVVP
jgi:hypothetical protein